jgi:hypothetical protein
MVVVVLAVVAAVVLPRMRARRRRKQRAAQHAACGLGTAQQRRDNPARIAAGLIREEELRREVEPGYSSEVRRRRR